MNLLEEHEVKPAQVQITFDKTEGRHHYLTLTICNGDGEPYFCWTRLMQVGDTFTVPVSAISLQLRITSGGTFEGPEGR